MAGAIPGDQMVDVVTVGAVAAKTLLVEKSLDATAEANLVGVILNSYGPAHFLMPAASQHRYRCPCQPGGHNPNRPQPTMLALLTHLTATRKTSSAYDEPGGEANPDFRCWRGYF